MGVTLYDKYNYLFDKSANFFGKLQILSKNLDVKTVYNSENTRI